MASKAKRRARRAAREAKIHPEAAKPLAISDSMLAWSRRTPTGPDVFGIAQHPPRVLPSDEPSMAQDEQIIEVNAWASAAIYGGAITEGVTFLGYPTLSALAQRTEYRRVSEVLAIEATRKWIKLGSTSDDKAKAPKITELEAEMVNLDVQGAFRKLIELDGFFGRSHLYLDTGSTDDRAELQTSIGLGNDVVTRNKFAGRTGFLKAVKPVEPVWCYPAKYNATDPLKPDWYNPQTWFCQGKEIHVSRLLLFVGREVPDLLKPSYSFGGLSLSQMAKPYIDNWLRTRQAIADLIWSFSVSGLATDLSTLSAEDGDNLFRRAALFANNQTNQGLFLINKEKEEFFRVVTPLGTLDALQSQCLEHICTSVATPAIKFTGIQPAGFNASSEGEMESWYDNVEAFQKKFMKAKLKVVMDFIMLSLWGEVDDDITFEFESLRATTKKEDAEIGLIEAQTDQIYTEIGAIGPEDIRGRLTADPDSPYDGLGEELPNDGSSEFNDNDLLQGAGALGLGPREERQDRGRPREPGESPGRDDRTAAPRAREGRDRFRGEGLKDPRTEVDVPGQVSIAKTRIRSPTG